MIIRLFYSNKCKECMNIWQVVCNEDIKRMFIPVCLDNYTSKDIEKLSIKRIPSIVVSVENHKPAVYEGSFECSKWLNTFTANRRKNLLQRVEQQRKTIQKDNNEHKENGPIEYTSNEMDGVADEYAYLNTDLSQPKNFLPIGMENTQIHTPNNLTYNDKLTAREMASQQNTLKNARAADEQQIKQIMEQNQINAVLNTQVYN